MPFTVDQQITTQTDQPQPRNIFVRVAGYTAAVLAGAFFWSNFTPPPPQQVGAASQCNSFIVQRGYASRYPSVFWSPFFKTSADQLDWIPQTNQPYLRKPQLSSSQQQASVAPISESVEAVSADKFVQPTNQPYLVKQYLHASKQQASFWGILTPSSQPQQSFSPASVPLSFVVKRSYASLISNTNHSWGILNPIFVPQVLWFPEYPSKVYTKPSTHASQQQSFFYDSSFAPEVVTVDKFAQPTNQPYLTRQFSRANYQAEFRVPLTPPTQPNFGGSSAGLLPFVYKRSYASRYESFSWGAFTPGTTVAINYWYPVTPDQTYGKKSILAAQQQAVFWNPLASPEVVTADRFSQPQSQPQKRKFARGVYEYALYVATPEPATADRFAQPTNQPYLQKRYLHASQQQAVFWSAFTPPPAAPVNYWFGVYPDQTYGKTPLRHQPHVTSGFDSAVNDLSWAQPTNQPYFTKNYAVAQQPSFFWGYIAPVITSFNYQPTYQDVISRKFPRATYEYALSVSTPVVQISQPTYPDIIPGRRYLTSNQQSVFYNVSTAVENVSADKFVQPTNQPYLVKRYLLAAQQQAFFWGFVSTPEVVTADKFIQPISQPYLIKKYPLTGNDAYFFWGYFFSPEVVTADKFIQPISQPYLQKQYLSTAQQQAMSWGVFTPAPPPVVTEFFAYYPDFIEGKPYLVVANIPSFFWSISSDAEIVSADRWEQPTNQPYPYKQLLNVALQHSVEFNPFVVPTAVIPPCPLIGSGTTIEQVSASGVVINSFTGVGQVLPNIKGSKT